MTAGSIFDIGLAFVVLAVAGWTISVRDTLTAVVGFVLYGLLLALIWVRLSLFDVALTEAAIGSGITGVLLLRAATRVRNGGDAAKRPVLGFRVIAALFCALVSAALAAVVLYLPDPAPSLAPLAAASLNSTDLGNPVTAVLIAYRAFDTFLEKVVLLLALVGIWSLAPDRSWGGVPEAWRSHDRDGVLTFFAQVLPPVGIVVGIYIFWNGADQPGGAFQGGAILGAMGILVVLAGLGNLPATSRRDLRLVLAAGAMLFLVVGLGGLMFADAFLAYPAGYAKALIITIEAAMTLSVAATLAYLVAGPPEHGEQR